SMQQMTTVSADTVTNSTALIWIALLLRLALDPETRLEGRILKGLLICGLVVVTSKLAYLPLLLLYFLCGRAKAGSHRRYAALFGGLAATSILLVAAWLVAVMPLFQVRPPPSNRPIISSPAPDVPPSSEGARHSINPRKQAAFIVRHPVRYFRALASSIAENWVRYIQGSLGYAGRLPV
ncbi:MAG: DUF2142 domain-containing protein, partial [bacterium]|nr:DUF2142 domain-containing protein [bacterium]